MGFYEVLNGIFRRPAPFEFYTAEELWTGEHTSRQMLSFHLAEDSDLASRKPEFIDRSVDWLVEQFRIGENSRIADFGCGPGLYAARLAQHGAQVTGIDFSGRSIEYARQAAARQRLQIRYLQENYLDFETGERFDLILMIYCDFCALSPAQRKVMLSKFQRLLRPGGAVVLDVYSLAAFAEKQETAACEVDLMEGFWSPDRYYGFLNTFKYQDAKVSLDKYTIIERQRIWTVYNWLQYFEPGDLEREFSEAGLTVASLYSDVAGAPYDPGSAEFAAVAHLSERCAARPAAGSRANPEEAVNN